MNDETKQQTPKTRSASVRIDPEVHDALETVRAHICDELPGIRPNTSDVLRWALLDSAKRIERAKDLANHVAGIPAPLRGQVAGFDDVA